MTAQARKSDAQAQPGLSGRHIAAVTIVGEHVVRGLGSREAPWSKVDAALAAAGYRVPTPLLTD